jgi:hypothetical protein
MSDAVSLTDNNDPAAAAMSRVVFDDHSSSSSDEPSPERRPALVFFSDNSAISDDSSGESMSSGEEEEEGGNSMNMSPAEREYFLRDVLEYTRPTSEELASRMRELASRMMQVDVYNDMVARIPPRPEGEQQRLVPVYDEENDSISHIPARDAVNNAQMFQEREVLIPVPQNFIDVPRDTFVAGGGPELPGPPVEWPGSGGIDDDDERYYLPIPSEEEFAEFRSRAVEEEGRRDRSSGPCPICHGREASVCGPITQIMHLRYHVAPGDRIRVQLEEMMDRFQATGRPLDTNGCRDLLQSLEMRQAPRGVMLGPAIARRRQRESNISIWSAAVRVFARSMLAEQWHHARSILTMHETNVELSRAEKVKAVQLAQQRGGTLMSTEELLAAARSVSFADGPNEVLLAEEEAARESVDDRNRRTRREVQERGASVWRRIPVPPEELRRISESIDAPRQQQQNNGRDQEADIEEMRQAPGRRREEEEVVRKSVDELNRQANAAWRRTQWYGASTPLSPIQVQAAAAWRRIHQNDGVLLSPEELDQISESIDREMQQQTGDRDRNPNGLERLSESIDREQNREQTGLERLNESLGRQQQQPGVLYYAPQDGPNRGPAVVERINATRLERARVEESMQIYLNALRTRIGIHIQRGNRAETGRLRLLLSHLETDKCATRGLRAAMGRRIRENGVERLSLDYLDNVVQRLEDGASEDDRVVEAQNRAFNVALRRHNPVVQEADRTPGENYYASLIADQTRENLEQRAAFVGLIPPRAYDIFAGPDAGSDDDLPDLVPTFDNGPVRLEAGSPVYNESPPELHPVVNDGTHGFATIQSGSASVVNNTGVTIFGHPDFAINDESRVVNSTAFVNEDAARSFYASPRPPPPPPESRVDNNTGVTYFGASAYSPADDAAAVRHFRHSSLGGSPEDALRELGGVAGADPPPPSRRMFPNVERTNAAYGWNQTPVETLLDQPRITRGIGGDVIINHEPFSSDDERDLRIAQLQDTIQKLEAAGDTRSLKAAERVYETLEKALRVGRKDDDQPLLTRLCTELGLARDECISAVDSMTDEQWPGLTDEERDMLLRFQISDRLFAEVAKVCLSRRADVLNLSHFSFVMPAEAFDIEENERVRKKKLEDALTRKAVALVDVLGCTVEDALAALKLHGGREDHAFAALEDKRKIADEEKAPAIEMAPKNIYIEQDSLLDACEDESEIAQREKAHADWCLSVHIGAGIPNSQDKTEEGKKILKERVHDVTRRPGHRKEARKLLQKVNQPKTTKPKKKK